MTVDELIEAIKAEVLALIAAGVIPAAVTTFEELHEHVDANCLGGTEDLWDLLAPNGADDATAQQARDTLFDLMEPAHIAVDAWLRSGRVIVQDLEACRGPDIQAKTG